MRGIRTFFAKPLPTDAPLELTEKEKISCLPYTQFNKFSNAAIMTALVEKP